MNRVARLVAIMIVFAGVASPARAEAGKHCAYLLVPTASEGVVTDAELALIGCYDTFAEALRGGSGGAIDVAPTVTPETLTDEALLVDVASDLLIGTEYDGSNYSQGSSSYYAPVTCSATQTWQVAWVGATWNDRFQSGKGFGGCDVNRKFQHIDFGGTFKTCTPNCTDYGTLANEVSSLRWRP